MLPAQPDAAPLDTECRRGLNVGIERLAHHGITVVRTAQLLPYDLAVYEHLTGTLHVCRNAGPRAACIAVHEFWKRLAMGPTGSAYEARPTLSLVR